MKTVVTSDREKVVAWAEEKIRAIDGTASFPTGYGIGLADGGVLVAAVVFTGWSDGNVNGHIASDGSKKWLTKSFLRAMFDYPFNQLKCNRITAPIAEKNVSAQRFVSALGFKLEGRLRKAIPDGSDRLIYGLLREECRYV